MKIPYWIRKPWYGICNVVRWAPVIWVDFDWDYTFLVKIMEYKLRRMSDNLKDGYTLNAPRYAQKALIGAELCRRINHDNYYDTAKTLYPSAEQWKNRNEYVRSVQKQDLEMLGNIFSKYLIHWWD